MWFPNCNPVSMPFVINKCMKYVIILNYKKTKSVSNTLQAYNTLCGIFPTKTILAFFFSLHTNGGEAGEQKKNKGLLVQREYNYN